MHVQLLSGAVALAVMGSVTSAALIENFEGTWSGAGTVVTDPEDSGNKALLLKQGSTGPVNFAASGDGTVTMRVFDFGQITDTGDGSTTDFGPRWGVFSDTDTSVTTDNRSAAVSNMNRTGLIGNVYGYSTEITKTGSWFSPSYYSARTAAASPALHHVDAFAPTPGIEGDGAWTTWTFLIEGSNVKITNTGNTVVRNVTNFTNPLTEIWLYGGSSGATNDLAIPGALFDDITFTPVPEPATLGLLAGVGMLAMRRRRA